MRLWDQVEEEQRVRVRSSRPRGLSNGYVGVRLLTVPGVFVCFLQTTNTCFYCIASSLLCGVNIGT